MPAVEHRPSSRKRRAPSPVHHSVDECLPASKRHKASSAHREPSPSFWDRLSRVQLSRQGLREFDRRTLSHNDLATRAPPASLAPLPSTAAAAASLVDRPRKSDLVRLQRFARRGGPALAHLRGVGSSVLVPVLNHADPGTAVCMLFTPNECFQQSQSQTIIGI